MADTIAVVLDQRVDVLDVPVSLVITQEPVRVIEVVQEGPQGAPGPIADLNTILGHVDTAVSDYFVLHPQSFVYDQGTEVFRVEILHPLDHLPAVVATDSAGDVWRGAVTYPAANRVAVAFNVPFAGRFTLT